MATAAKATPGGMDSDGSSSGGGSGEGESRVASPDLSHSAYGWYSDRRDGALAPSWTTPMSMDVAGCPDKKRKTKAVGTRARKSREASSPERWDCPLFMTSLPSDFAQNPGLAAIAALIEEGEEDKKSVATEGGILPTARIPKAGGGKCATAGGRRRKSSPYHRSSSPAKGVRSGHANRAGHGGATMGEAQLFLKMWKI
mmetsp:Transcript_2638/g.5675  ORF Transcript_2638/g.5675 Transcript_2638/m.5675 type:complete len:199 (-) Transcript_2638:442-1038(-)|eukprot:CAMPEP_0183304224 /NCGR_PEP_ID=MMETSP0160_2-20130417/9385_1 /TAXON_ID=2839 ORGANISM="Odontella Sinensis, Strain Grunow 1884" /NCGR_SAMPLE_ID=MMETSP0160_2 /ASSEMBLY_ACC=CAM_ASM_000250 /LENGTH=198 /DNA_ID=CAMNT_0025467233 /DNA_START=28 /DNA_END=624 /DNA_ORIENTATION=-